jgi:nitroreductase
MEIKELVRKNRSYRRFHQDVRIDMGTLRELVDLTRYCASARNGQPLKYILSCDQEKNELIFPHLAWAGYLKDWTGPKEGEKPAAYIVVLGDKRITKSFDCDHGIAAQSMLLGAIERGYGGCIVASVKRDALRVGLNIEVHFEILFVVALGKPAETVQIEPMGSDGGIAYWRDENDVHHVPKRALDDIVIG